MIFYILGGIFLIALIPTLNIVPNDDHNISRNPVLNSKKVIKSR